MQCLRNVADIRIKERLIIISSIKPHNISYVNFTQGLVIAQIEMNCLQQKKHPSDLPLSLMLLFF